MKLLTPEQVSKVYEITDEIGLHRNAVIVPLSASDDGVTLLMPDGRLLLRPPHGEAFGPWHAALPGQLQAMDLTRPLLHR